MKLCALCGKEVAADKYSSRKSTCASCGADLHICLNCRFYSPTSHNKCVEPKAEFQRLRDRANFCDYFEFKKSWAGAVSPFSNSENARKAFDDLFRKG